MHVLSHSHTCLSDELHYVWLILETLQTFYTQAIVLWSVLQNHNPL